MMMAHDPSELTFVPREPSLLDRFGDGDEAKLKRHLIALAAFLKLLPPNTKRVYRTALRQFLDTLRWPCPDTVTVAHAAAFKKWLITRKGASNATAYHRMSAMKSYFDFLEARGLVSANPFRDARNDIKPPTSDRVTAMAWVTFEKLLNQMPSDPVGLRDRAMLLFYAYTGIPRPALAGLRIRDLSLTSKPMTYTIRRRGRTETYELPRICYEAIKAYWIAADRLHMLHADAGVFTATRESTLTVNFDAPISIRMMNHILANAAKRAGVPLGRVRIHGVRHLAPLSSSRSIRLPEVRAFLRNATEPAVDIRALLVSPSPAKTASKVRDAAIALVERREASLRF